MLTFLKDLRLALRSWSKATGVLLIAVLSLGLGIGVTTTIFTVVNAALFTESTGLEDPDRLVQLFTSSPDGERHFSRSSYADFERLSSSLAGTESMAASRTEPMTLGENEGQRILLAEKVTWNYFDVLGIRPILGRAFSPADSGGDEERLAILSHRLWLRSFDANPAIVGQTVTLGSESFEVLGVTPQNLDMGNPFRETDVWVPLVPGNRSAELAERRDLRRLEIFARLDAATTLDQIQAQLDVAAANLHRDRPQNFENLQGEPLTFSVLTEQDSRITPDRRALLLVIALFPLAVAGLILMIACSNVATLFLARAETRGRETALRLALGAGRARLVSLFLAESLVPGLASGVLGIALASGAARYLETLSLPAAIPVALDFGLDVRVVFFGLAMALGTTILFGLVPALAHSRPDLVSALKSSAGAGGKAGRGRWRRILVVVQVAASLVLIVGSGLFYRGAQNAARMDLGFDPNGIALTSAVIPAENTSAEARRLWLQNTLESLRSQPGVMDAQASRALEMSMASAQETPIRTGSSAAATDDAVTSFRNEVTPGYLEMLGVNLLEGRTIGAEDVAGGMRAAVVNDVFAARFWPSGEALGGTFEADRIDATGTKTTETLTVVGIVRDGKFLDIDDPPLPYYWTSLLQAEEPSQVVLLVKGLGNEASLVELLRQEVTRQTNEVTLLSPRTYTSIVDIQFLFGRVVMRILGWGGAFGLLLAAIGIYGIVSFSVAVRTRELAIRVAVGAAIPQIVRNVAREGLKLAGIGAALGTITIVPLAHALRSQLFGISPADPAVLTIGALILLTIALVASVIPARRALAIDPVQALRED